MTKPIEDRIEIPAEDPQQIVTQKAKKLYRILLGLMRRENCKTIWLHDGMTAQLIHGKQSELKAVAIELRTANLISTRQSKSGCEFTLLQSTLKTEAA